MTADFFNIFLATDRNLVETCLDDSVGFFSTVKDAVELFEKKEEDAVKEEGMYLGELVGMYWSGSGARRAVRRAAAA